MNNSSTRSAQFWLHSGILTALPVLLLIISIAFTANALRAAHSEQAEKQLGIARQARNDMDYRIAQHQEIAYGLMLSVINTINGDWDSPGTYHEYTELSANLTPFADRGMIASIRLYVPDQKFYSSQRDTFYPLSDLRSDLYAAYAEPGLHWIPTHNVRIAFDHTAPCISLMYHISRPDNYSLPAAALILYIPVTSLNSIFEANLSGSDEMFLSDSHGLVLAHSDRERIDQIMLNDAEKATLFQASDSYTVSRGRVLAASRLAGTDWYLVASSADVNLFALDPSRMLVLVVIWIITILAFGYLILMLLHNRLIGETMRTIRSMTRSFFPEQADITISTQNKALFLTNSQLEKELEDTVESLTRSIQRYYQNQIDLVNYQMQSLQAQIKPHFLYNTLDIIKWKIMEENTADAVFMVNALSRYLRMSINRTNNLVTLRQEMELSKIYLEIMQKRFTNRFQTSFDLEDDTLECDLPRLILQPIMENALLHGLLYCEKPGALLQCRSWHEENKLVIEVEDNGSGMSADTLARLEQDDPMYEQGLGLGNVKKRLRLFGGNDAAMHIHSQPGIGTCVSLFLPYTLHSEQAEQPSVIHP